MADSPRPNTPYMSLALRLHPKQYECQFWQSELYKTGTKYIDTWARYMALAGHCFFIRWQAQLKGPSSTFRVYRSVLLMAWSIGQIVWARRSFTSYFRWRPYILWSNRLPIFLSVTFRSPVVVRSFIRGGSEALIHASAAPSSWLPLPAYVSAVKLLLFISHTVFVLQDAFNPPLPTSQQLFLHSLYALLLPFAVLHPAAHVLAPHTPQLRTICSSINNNFLFVSTIIAPIDIVHSTEHLGQQCDQHSVHILIIFCILYLGLLLPVFVSYRLEQHMKQLYLHQLLLQHNEVVAAEELQEQIAMPHMQDALMPVLLIIPAWVAAVCLHSLVAATAFPL